MDMSYTLLIQRISETAKRLSDPNQDTEAVERQLKFLTEKVRGYAEGTVYMVRAKNSQGQEGWVYLTNLELPEVQEFTEKILRLEYINHEAIPIGKLLILS